MNRLAMYCGLTAILVAAANAPAVPLGSAFTYQGRLDDGPDPANGAHVMAFRLFDLASGGAQVGPTLTFDGVSNPLVDVDGGLFTVSLDFGPAALSGQARWLEIAVEGNTLAPRQRLSPAPYASFAAVAGAPWTSLGSNIGYTDGNVGIGTTTPGNKLSVLGGVTVDASGANSGTIANTLRFGGDTHGEGIGSKKTAGGNQHGIDFYTGHAARMSISNTGNVGVGTTSPGARLQVNSTSRLAQIVESSDTAGTWVALNNTTMGGRYWQLISTGSGNGEGAGKLLIGHGATAGFTAPAMTVTQTGEVGIGTSFPGATLDVIGTTRTRVIQITGGSDIAEPFNVNLAARHHGKKSATTPLPGMVVAIDPANTGELRLCDRAYDRTVAGIISGAGGVNPGMTLQQEGTLLDGKHPVALTGRVYCLVDTDANGPVRPGDLLTTSDTVGHAMRVTDPAAAHGAIIGKAMSTLEEGKGLVLVLVSLQ